MGVKSKRKKARRSEPIHTVVFHDTASQSEIKRLEDQTEAWNKLAKDIDKIARIFTNGSYSWTESYPLKCWPTPVKGAEELKNDEQYQLTRQLYRRTLSDSEYVQLRADARLNNKDNH